MVSIVCLLLVASQVAAPLAAAGHVHGHGHAHAPHAPQHGDAHDHKPVGPTLVHLPAGGHAGCTICDLIVTSRVTLILTAHVSGASDASAAHSLLTPLERCPSGSARTCSMPRAPPIG